MKLCSKKIQIYLYGWLGYPLDKKYQDIFVFRFIYGLKGMCDKHPYLCTRTAQHRSTYPDKEFLKEMLTKEEQEKGEYGIFR